MLNQLLSKLESNRTNSLWLVALQIVPFWWKKFFKKTVLKNLLASQTNSTHKHSKLGSQITEPINAWKGYFRSPPAEIYARNLQWINLSVSHCSQSEKNFFFAARFFLEAVGAKWGRQQRERLLESKTKSLGRRIELVKENAAAWNEPINFRERIIMLISGIGHVSLSPLIIIVIFWCW